MPEPTPAGEQAPRLLLVRLDQIRRDGGTQSRARLDSATATLYAESMRNGAKFPEPVLFLGRDDRADADPDDRTLYYWLASGFHRYEAYDQNGVKSVFCKVFDGGVRAAILFSVGENFKHGLQRSPQDKRHAVRLLLADPDWWRNADQWIADQCHVGKTLVGTVRHEMEAEWRMRQEASKPPTASAPSPNGSGVAATPENPPLIAPGPPTGHRTSRTRYGGIRTQPVPGAEPKAPRSRPAPVRPVIVETELEEIAKKTAQVVRSIPKAIRQAKALGWSWDKYVEESRKVWDSIPLATE